MMHGQPNIKTFWGANILKIARYYVQNMQYLKLAGQFYFQGRS